MLKDDLKEILDRLIEEVEEQYKVESSEIKYLNINSIINDVAQAIIDRLEIDLDKMVDVFSKYIVALGWEKRVGDYIKFKGLTESDYLPALKAIVKAKPIKIKRGD